MKPLSTDNLRVHSAPRTVLCSPSVSLRGGTHCSHQASGTPRGRVRTEVPAPWQARRTERRTRRDEGA